jgi:hypothetical protein
MEEEFDEGTGKFEEDGFDLFLNKIGLLVIIGLNKTKFLIFFLFTALNKHLDELRNFILMEHHFHVFSLNWDVELNSQILRI